MPDSDGFIKSEFRFGNTLFKIIEGDILDPGVEVDLVVSTDDNYLTMSGGVSWWLKHNAGPYYVRAAQAQSPVPAGTVVITKPYRLTEHLPQLKQAFHGAVIDYDSRDLSLEEIVFQTTLNCLNKAEEFGLQQLLFPAFATGPGGISMDQCAQQMGRAVKQYLAQERSIRNIYIILYDRLPAADRQQFVRAANLVLGVPYDPASRISQTRDFFGPEDKLEALQEIVSGKRDDEAGKYHAVVLGGPKIGKWMLLDELYCRARQADEAVGQGRHLVKVTFGHVHKSTPLSFIYRKFLNALAHSGVDEAMRDAARGAFPGQEMNCDLFLDFLKQHADRLAEVVFLIDELPSLLEMEGRDLEDESRVQAFWRDLDRLQERVRFVYTARDDEEYERLRRERLERFAPDFCSRIIEIQLKCVTEQGRKKWIDDLYQNYLDRKATDVEQEYFFDVEAGQHPFLISLACFALVKRIVEHRIAHPEDPEQNEEPLLRNFFQDARRVMEAPRRTFFAQLVDSLDREHRVDLETLAQAVVLEEEKRLLASGIQAGDPNAEALWRELQAEGDPREHLHEDRLAYLERSGYLRVFEPEDDKAKAAQFMAKSFGAYVADLLRPLRPKDDRPERVIVSLLRQGDTGIRTMFRGRGARVVTAQKQLRPDVKEEFKRSFAHFIHQRLHPNQDPDRSAGVFADVEQVSNYILTQFTDVTIKRYLEKPVPGSSVFFLVDDAHKDIPWELMLEAVYAGEIPFRVGRSIVSSQEPHPIRPTVRGLRKVKALLIGDPGGNLGEAVNEVQRLGGLLRGKGEFFEEPDIWIGPEQCQRIRLLNALASGKYGLIHYSGHTRFENDQSAWQLRDGDITTDMLTNATQMAPPAFVFSSSCESATEAGAQTIRYEDQTFDLPGAFLQAGVEAYVGTLWSVNELAARLFSEQFYEAFLSGEHSLGECLRQARWALKQQEERNNQLNWLAFILYGDPNTMPADLFPALGRQG